MKGRPAIEFIRNCRTASEFLERLAPGHRDWGRQAGSWIYRGQANATWGLKPLGLRRPDAFIEFGAETAPRDWNERAPALKDLLARFRRGLNDSGMAVPAESPPIYSNDQGGGVAGDLPRREAFPLMALAQHHGLPTLLLDWSSRATVAAYFAGSYAVDPRSEGLGAAIAVWALRTTSSFDNPHAALWRKSGHLELYSAPGSSNPNLRAQGGSFTVLWGDEDPDLEKHLEERLRERRRTKEPRKAIPRLGLFTLPRREAPALLELLSAMGLTAASMFPGIDGVVRGMREEAIWRDAGKRLQRVFRLRAETVADLGELLLRIGVERIHIARSMPSLPDVEATLVGPHIGPKPLDLETLRRVIASIRDAHVMAETLAPVGEYTAERTYGGSPSGRRSTGRTPPTQAKKASRGRR